MRWITHITGGPKRVNHAAVVVGHKIYSFGGYCTGENSREYTSMDVHVLNTSTFRWTKHPVSDLPYFEYDDILPYKRYGHSAVVHDDKIYVWGGRNDRASCAILFCFDTAYCCWTAPKVTGEIPLARDGHVACMWRNFMFIFGGYEEDTDTFANSVYALNLDRMHWSCIRTKGTAPEVRDFHTTVCIEDKMYLFGGRGTDSRRGFYLPDEETYSDDLWCLNLVTFEWSKLLPSGDKPVGRRSHSAFVYNNKMYIFGGYNGLKEQHYNDMYEFDPINCSWMLLSPVGDGPCNRRRQACVVVGDRVFLFGGTSPISYFPKGLYNICDDKLIDHNDMYVLDFLPSLKTLCVIAVNDYKLDYSELPDNVQTEIANMFMPNKLAVGRPNNSTG